MSEKVCKVRPQVEVDLLYHVPAGAFALPVHPDPRFEAAVQWVAQRFQIGKLFVSIAIVDDVTIGELNAQHLGHDWATDVISFVLDQSHHGLEGEIIASAETAARLCQSAGWTAADELLLYVIHGLLHVAGLDDLDAEQQRLMRTTEQECLLALGVPGAEEYLQRFADIFCSEVEQ